MNIRSKIHHAVTLARGVIVLLCGLVFAGAMGLGYICYQFGGSGKMTNFQFTFAVLAALVFCITIALVGRYVAIAAPNRVVAFCLAMSALFATAGAFGDKNATSAAFIGGVMGCAIAGAVFLGWLIIQCAYTMLTMDKLDAELDNLLDAEGNSISVSPVDKTDSASDKEVTQ